MSSVRDTLLALLANQPDLTARKMANLAKCSASYAHTVATEFNLRKIGSMPTPWTSRIDAVYRSTLARLETLALRVSEGKDIAASSEFARFFVSSGIAELIGEHKPSDGQKLCKIAADLVEACNERFQSGSTEAKIEAVQFQSLQEQLANLTQLVMQQKAA
jgi:hypothetical protein